MSDNMAIERQEWIESLDSIAANLGNDAAVEILEALSRRAEELGIRHRPLPYTAYRNTISLKSNLPIPVICVSKNILLQSCAGTHWQW